MSREWNGSADNGGFPHGPRASYQRASYMFRSATAEGTESAAANAKDGNRPCRGDQPQGQTVGEWQHLNDSVSQRYRATADYGA